MATILASERYYYPHTKLGKHQKSEEKKIPRNSRVNNNGASKFINVAEGRTVGRQSVSDAVKSRRSTLLVKDKEICPLVVADDDDPVRIAQTQDLSFRWADENYSYLRRTSDIWLFVLSLRLRLLSEDAKWAYPDGFSEEKQVMFHLYLHSLTLIIYLFSVSLYMGVHGSNM